MRPNLLLYAITDRKWLKEGQCLADAVEDAIRGGATMVQLREKDCDEQELLRLAREIKVVCRRWNVPFLINDSISVAARCGADGVHLGQGDEDPVKAREILGKDAIIGVTAKTVEQAKQAKRDGADYIGTGAVFATSTKGDAIGIPHERIREIKAAVDLPMTAIGGITRENVGKLKGLGMDGIAVVSGIFGAANVGKAARELKQAAYEVTGKMPSALTIAGSDSSGGAGIQADLKTFTVNGVFGQSVITSITAQNTLGVNGVFDLTAEAVRAQIDAVFQDIFPDAVKIGMVSSEEIIREISEGLRRYRPRFTVVDPVMVSTSGHMLLREGAVETLKTALFPLADVITPNLQEAALLWGREIHTAADMTAAAKEIHEAYGCAVLVKGGHLEDTSDDLFYSETGVKWFCGKRIQNPNTHGTGCTLSSAIAAFLARGYSVEESIGYAKDYITGAIVFGLNLGRGRGPLWHGYCIR